jgi:hypothetical protein
MKLFSSVLRILPEGRGPVGEEDAMTIGDKSLRWMTLRSVMLAGGGLAIVLFLVISSARAANTLGLWSPLSPAPSAYAGHTATLLLDGKILVAGGQVGRFTYSASAALSRPDSDDWLALPSMFLPHGKHGAALAGDGTVVVAGGEAESHLVAVLDPPCGIQVPPDADSVVEIFDPSTLRWRFGPAMSQRRALFQLVPLADGRLLAAGGADSRDAGGSSTET